MFKLPTQNANRFFFLSRCFSYLLIILTILRLVFYLANRDQFEILHLSDLLWSFVVGGWYDLNMIVMAFSILILAYLIPFKESFWSSKPWRLFEKVYYTIMVPVLIIPNILDIELYHYQEQRSTGDIIPNKSDLLNMALPMITGYPHLLLLGLTLVGGAIYLCCRKRQTHWNISLSGKQWALFSLFILSLSLLTGRGGYRGKPLRPPHAIKLNLDRKLASISLNSTHTIMHSLRQKQLQKMSYFEDDGALLKQLKSGQKFHFSRKRFDNVVIIIMESIGSEFTTNDKNPVTQIPFLESIAKKGLYYPISFSTGSLSRIAPYSVFASMPEVNLGPLLYSAYSQTKVYGVGDVLSQYGYQTSFFHNGKRGVFYFDTQAQNSGLSDYYGMEDFQGTPLLKNDWGIDDLSFADFIVEKHKNMKEPFISTYFTLSNHAPYEFPAPFDGPPLPGEEPKQKGARFTDFAIKKMMEGFKKLPFYKNTLFVFTGDHTPHQRHPEWKPVPDHSHLVPLIMYHPSVDLSVYQDHRITKHTDILPSVLDFIGIGRLEKHKMTPFGQSVFAPNPNSHAFFGMRDEGHLIISDWQLIFDSKTDKMTATHLKFPWLNLPKKPKKQWYDYGRFLVKGYLQYYNNGVKSNNLYELGPNEIISYPENHDLKSASACIPKMEKCGRGL